MPDEQNTSIAEKNGALTQVMLSAETKAAKRALRVGLVKQGRVIFDKVIEAGKDVTIGPNERAVIVINHPSIPPQFRLFQSKNGGYDLHVSAGMEAHVANGENTQNLQPKTNSLEQTIALSPTSRGKLILGEHVILFQFVAVAEAAKKPPLPANLKSNFGDIDVRTSAVAAFSFLVHFGAVGSVYSDWMDPVVSDEVDTTQILESVSQLPQPPPLEKPSEESTAAATKTAASEPSKAPSASGGRGMVSGGASAGNTGNARAHQLSSQMAALELQMVANLGGNSGSATNSVLSGGDLPLGMLDKAAASADGARNTQFGSLNIGGGGGPVRPGSMSRNSIYVPPTDVGPVTAGSAVAVKPVVGSVGVGGAGVTSGVVSDASSRVSAMTPGFRRCYNLGLRNEDPSMKGSVRFTVKIGPNGDVTSVTGAPSGSLTPSVVGCMRARVASTQFSPPGDGGAMLIIPVVVIPGN